MLLGELHVGREQAVREAQRAGKREIRAAAQSRNRDPEGRIEPGGWQREAGTRARGRRVAMVVFVEREETGVNAPGQSVVAGPAEAVARWKARQALRTD